MISRGLLILSQSSFNRHGCNLSGPCDFDVLRLLSSFFILSSLRSIGLSSSVYCYKGKYGSFSSPSTPNTLAKNSLRTLAVSLSFVVNEPS